MWFDGRFFAVIVLSRAGRWLEKSCTSKRSLIIHHVHCVPRPGLRDPYRSAPRCLSLISATYSNTGVCKPHNCGADSSSLKTRPRRPRAGLYRSLGPECHRTSTARCIIQELLPRISLLLQYQSCRQYVAWRRSRSDVISCPASHVEMSPPRTPPRARVMLMMRAHRKPLLATCAYLLCSLTAHRLASPPRRLASASQRRTLTAQPA